MKKILAFGHTLDTMFFSRKASKYIHILLPDTAINYLKLFKNFKITTFKYAKISIDELSESELFKINSIKEAVKKSGCKSYLISHRSTKINFSAIKKINLTPVGNDYRWAEKLEDKLYFDKLLSSLKLPKPKTVNKELSKIRSTDLPIVIQEPKSFGSFGTKIIHSSLDLNINSLSKKKFLIREFIDGSVFGITVIIHKKGVIFSSLRQQCYYNDSSALPTFAGIQWIPHNQLAKSTIKKIEEMFNRLSTNLYEKNFYGIHNFDFILRPNNDLAILEANPRPSSATPHLLINNNLIHGLDLGLFLTGHKTKLLNKPYLPKYNFDGALFDLMALKNIKLKAPVIRELTEDLSKANYWLFSTNLKIESMSKGDFLGMILSNKRLFTKNGFLNSEAKKLYQKYTGIHL